MPVVLPKRPSVLLTHTPIASAVLLALGSPSAVAQQTPQEGGSATALGEVIVTARYDQDGDAMTKQPGDITGQARLKLPAANVQIVLDTVL